jgi:DNA-directed RNA polymerase subunit beta'
MPTHAHLTVKEGEEVHAGDVLAKIPRATTKTKDITGGLPRVVELFEARKPRETAIIAEINGTVKYGDVTKGQRKVIIRGDDGQEREYLVPRGIHINVQEGERIKAGDPLMDGPRNPHDILSVLGETELQKYLVNEVQEVYRLQGVNINDKHLETIVRQMMRWVRVEEIGDTEFLPEEVVDKFRFREENDHVVAAGGRPAQGKAVLLGITKASLSTDSFISAASFQETTRVLTEAAINGKVDYLRGLKENVIMGRLIPAGTGMEYYRRVKIAGEDLEEELMQETEVPAADGIEGYAEETRLHYSGGLTEAGDIESFEAE